ncbi:BRCT domain-containing protein [Pontibacter sp. BT731]|uniref:BRCT domain-containing protein n=1 Tax=Pontibacter coccineus TaxID=3063328 RepID=UPI0026E32DE8|nr:BRCT domain-containing protein [Pontibacter sp. BT731]MDO6389490.1 BRCT domain-containing protein [Pontibacter sp. BT731]
MKTDNYESLGYRQYTSLSEMDKAINSLKGILLGISMDNEVNDAELNELLLWCDKHKDLIKRNPFKNLIQTIYEAVSTRENRLELMEDIYWLCERYATDQNIAFYDLATADLQTLQGLCHGILSDGQIKDTEIKKLDQWLEQHEHLNTYYPYDEIYTLITSVLADGKIDDVERKRLMAYFAEFVKLTDEALTQKITTEISDIKIDGICTANPQVIFDGSQFCLTGLFSRGTRKELELEIRNLGGIINSDVTKKTNFLIVGDSGNPCYAFACYGRKVEKAIGLRKQGLKISLIHEFDFWDTIEDSKYN